MIGLKEYFTNSVLLQARVVPLKKDKEAEMMVKQPNYTFLIIILVILLIVIGWMLSVRFEDSGLGSGSTVSNLNQTVFEARDVTPIPTATNVGAYLNAQLTEIPMENSLDIAKHQQELQDIDQRDKITFRNMTSTAAIADALYRAAAEETEKAYFVLATLQANAKTEWQDQANRKATQTQVAVNARDENIRKNLNWGGQVVGILALLALPIGFIWIMARLARIWELRSMKLSEIASAQAQRERRRTIELEQAVSSKTQSTFTGACKTNGPISTIAYKSISNSQQSSLDRDDLPLAGD